MIPDITVYVNPKQQLFLDAFQKIRFALCGRGFGKSHLIGSHNVDKLKALPGAKSALVGMTYTHLKTKTLTVIKACWRGYGMEEYDPKTGEGDYVSFKKPPRKWIKNMIAPPDDWDYIISFPNGYHIELVSLANIDKARGASFDAMDIDEVAFLDEDDFTEVLSQTVRGNRFIFEGNPWHHSITLYTSIPWLPSGQWIYSFEELAKKYPDKYFWLEGNARDNIEALGPDWLEEQRERLPYIKFMVEVMNERISKLPDSFYYAFEEKKHSILPKQFVSFIRQFGFDGYETDNIISLYEQGGESLTTLYKLLESKIQEGEIDSTIYKYIINPNQSIDVTFDFNASFNSCIVGQHHPDSNTYTFHKEFFVKQESFTKLCEQIDKHYGHTHTKVINLYGDRNGNKRDASGAPTFFEQIIQKFTELGWQVNHISEGGVTQLHTLRHTVVNTLYEESELNLPQVRYHATTCKYTIISIINTPAKDNFKKDKSSEQKLGDDRRQEATDLGDASDYLLYDKFASLIGYSQTPVHILFPRR